jgi:hypothetical protein
MRYLNAGPDAPAARISRIDLYQVHQPNPVVRDEPGATGE